MTSSQSEDVPSLPEVALGKVSYFYKWVPIVGAVGVLFGFFVIFLYLSHFGLRSFIPDVFGRPENLLLISVGSVFIVSLFLIFLNYPWLLLTINFTLDSRKGVEGFRWSAWQLFWMYLLNASLMALVFNLFDGCYNIFFIISICLSIIFVSCCSKINFKKKENAGSLQESTTTKTIGLEKEGKNDSAIYFIFYNIITAISIAFSFVSVFIYNFAFFKETTYINNSYRSQWFVIFFVLVFQFIYMSIMYYVFSGVRGYLKRFLLGGFASFVVVLFLFSIMQFTPVKYAMRAVGLIEMQQDSRWYKPTEKMVKEKAINFDYFSKRAGENKKNERIKRETATSESKDKLMYGYFLIKIGSNAVFCPEYFGSEYLFLKEDGGSSVQSLTHELCIEVSPKDLSAIHAQANLTFNEATISKEDWPFKRKK